MMSGITCAASDCHRTAPDTMYCSKRCYLREYNRRRKAEDPEYAELCRRRSRESDERRMERYRSDPEYAEKIRQKNRDCRARTYDPERERNRRVENPLTDDQLRRKNAVNRERYWSNPEHYRTKYNDRRRERIAKGESGAVASLVRQRARARGRRRGMTPEQLEGLRHSQHGRCAVCGVVPEPGKDGRDGLHLDHRHDNGMVRGMLCSRCNRDAGTLDRDPEYLRSLAVYVQRNAPGGSHLVAVVTPCIPPREVG